jgi:RecA-family ATPase
MLAPRFLRPPDLRALPDLEWIIAGIIPRDALGVLFGEPGKGKTFVALSIALAVATGRSWLERRTAPGEVLYFAAEGLRGLKDRSEAFYQRTGEGDGSIVYSDDVFELRDREAVDQVCREIGEEGIRPTLIILDTLARFVVGADENSSRDMGEAIEGMDLLKRRTKATVLAVHHTVKNGSTERGSVCCAAQRTS